MRRRATLTCIGRTVICCVAEECLEGLCLSSQSATSSTGWSKATSQSLQLTGRFLNRTGLLEQKLTVTSFEQPAWRCPTCEDNRPDQTVAAQSEGLRASPVHLLFVSFTMSTWQSSSNISSYSRGELAQFVGSWAGSGGFLVQGPAQPKTWKVFWYWGKVCGDI